jgi:cobalt/nickel transport system permease protein
LQKENAMHIPDSMLQGSICPVTATVSAAGLIAAAYFGRKAKDKPSAGRFGAVAALIFAGQMMNFPILDGTSGHLLGGVLAASLLGTPFGVLAMALVVAVQSLVFSDGGVTVLGANIFNMAILGAGAGGLLRAALAGRRRGAFRDCAATAAAAWFSVVLASLAVGGELAVDGRMAFLEVAPAMLGVHALIGIAEAAITVAAWLLFAEKAATAGTAPGKAAAPLTAAAVVALMLSPFASGFPDGLEWVGAKYLFLHESAPAFAGLLSHYAIPWVGHEILSRGLAGLAGVLVTFIAAWAMLRLMGTLPHQNIRIR